MDRTFGPAGEPSPMGYSGRIMGIVGWGSARSERPFGLDFKSVLF